MYIDLNQAGQVATHDQIIADAVQRGVSPERIADYQRTYGGSEGELLVRDVLPVVL